MARLCVGMMIGALATVSLCLAQGPPGGGAGMMPGEQKGGMPPPWITQGAAHGGPSAAAVGGPATPAAGPTRPTAQPSARIAAPAGVSAPTAGPVSGMPPTGYGITQAAPMMGPMPTVQQGITRTGFNFTAWLVVVVGLIGGGLILRRFTRPVKQH